MIKKCQSQLETLFNLNQCKHNIKYQKINYHPQNSVEQDDLLEENWTETRIEILIDILEEARQPKLNLVVS